LSDKFSLLNISDSLKLNILCGAIDLKGSASFLKNESFKNKSVKGSIMLSIKTKKESFSLFDETIEKHYSLKAIEHTNCTHFITGIEWGTNIKAIISYIIVKYVIV
jgi:hypothetical protein